MRSSMMRVLLAMVLMLVLWACSSGPSQGDLDKARMNAKMHMQQVEAVKVALMVAGATGDTIDDMIASLVDMGMDTSEVEAALKAAGGEGADIAVLVNDILMKLKVFTDAKNKKEMEDEIAAHSAVYGLLATIDTDLVTEQPEQGVMKSSTQEDPDMKAWSTLYNTVANGPDLTMQDQMDSSWDDAKIPSQVITVEEDGWSAQGEFKGVAGTFSCTANCARPTFDDDGGITAPTGGDWGFEPDSASSMVAIKDEDYISYGFWLTKNDKGEPTAFDVFYASNGDMAIRAALPTAKAMDLKATYNGGASGKYLTRGADGTNGMPGYFTAEADLTAMVPVAGTAMVSGSISKFMDGNTMPLGDMKVDFMGGMAVADRIAKWVGKTSSESDVLDLGMGKWEATFYGADANTERSGFPAGVGGAFNYSWGLGAVQGALGAEYVKPATE